MAGPSFTSFRPGASGNPGGKPRMTDEQRVARLKRAAFQPELVDKFISMIRAAETEERLRVDLMKALLDKIDPDVSVEVTANAIEALTVEELKALAKRELRGGGDK